MKIKLPHILTVTVLTIAIVSASRAYALAGPGATAPSQSNIYAPVNNSSELQIKGGSLLNSMEGFGAGSGLGDYLVNDVNYFQRGVCEFFPEIAENSDPRVHARNLLAACSGPSGTGTMHPAYVAGASIGATKALLSPWGLFTNIIAKKIRIGGAGNDSAALPPIAPIPTTGSPIVLDLQGRGTSNNSTSGTQGISIYTGNTCSTYATIRTNTPVVQFSKLETNGTVINKADILARQVQLKSGNPARNDVLVSVDAAGHATWGKVTVVGNQLQVVPNN